MKFVGVLIRGLIQGYRLLLAPVLGANCRYEPSCSAYADEAVRRFGALHGSKLAILRVLRCHPWGGAGFDPVPEHHRSDAVGAPRTCGRQTAGVRDG